VVAGVLSLIATLCVCPCPVTERRFSVSTGSSVSASSEHRRFGDLTDEAPRSARRLAGDARVLRLHVDAPAAAH
jgi:hypothetical protein